MFYIAFVLGAVTLFYVWLKWNYTYWKRHKVCGPEPTLFVGNIGPTFTFSDHWGIVAEKWYKKYPNEPYIGYYKMLKPAILARDPDLIKDILITKFNSFRENDFNLSKKQDPLTAQNPFFTRDEEWTEGRKTLIPAFSQVKIKSVFPVMNGVGEEFVKFIKSYPKDTEFSAKELCLRFTTQNVIRCAFSIDPDCFNKEKESEFLKIGKALFAPSFLVGLKFLLMPILPVWLLDYIPLPFVPAEVDRMFREIVGTNKASRPENHQSNDILQVLLQIQKKHNFDDTFLAGHAVSLFGDGTETSSSAISYALYELAVNPHCQDKLYAEITENIANYDGQLTFESVQEMIYLEGVMMEALRIFPALLSMARVCTQTYTLPKTTRQTEPLTIHPGTVVNISVSGIHMDSKYYPEPEKFIPERFYPDECRNRHKATYLGFGEGPRICLGMRFAIVQVKVALALVVKNFRIKLSRNHKPIAIDPQTLLSYPRDGILIHFESR